MSDAGLIDELVGIVGPSNVLVGELVDGYVRDWTGRWTGACRAVVRPADTAEVSAVVAACTASGTAVVTQGGNTGLVGGAVPDAGSIVVSTTRLDRIGEVDSVAGQITVGAGATLAAVQAAASEHGWRYPIDFAARDSATIGGTIATNAGGHHVVRYGMTRRQVVGIEAVLADGRVISRLGGVVKDNTGYDLAGLICGSEGTLAIVTAARLILVPEAGESASALVGFSTLSDAMAAVGRLRRALPGLEAVELMCADGLALVGDHLGVSPPLPGCEAVLLVEAVDRSDPIAALIEGLSGLDTVVDTAVGADAAGSARLWRWREAHTEAINRAGPHPPHKLDVTVPLGAIAAFVSQLREAIADLAPGAQVWIFGHAGDGNLHVNITGPDPDDLTIDQLVLSHVAALGGSISAEHGIGRAKRQWLGLSRSPVEIATFHAIKASLDPRGLLNPGVLLP